MKKKLGILLAILLCAALLFTFVACGPKTDKNSNTEKNNTETEAGKTQGQGSISGVQASEVTAMETAIAAFLDSWLSANAQESVVDMTSQLSADLKASEAFAFVTRDASGEITEYAPTVQVNFDKSTGKYKISFTWNKGSLKREFEKAAVTVSYDNWAGDMNNITDYEALTEEGDSAAAIDKIVNAAFSTANDVAAKAPMGVFGVQAKVGVEVMGVQYSLEVKGNVNLKSAKDTELALSIVDKTGKAVGALYYVGAETPAECKLILQYGDTFKYIDYATLNDIVGQFFQPAEQEGEDVLPEGTLAEILKEFGVNGNVSGIVASVIDMLAQGYVKEGTNEDTYLIDINLNSVLSTLSELGGDLVTPEMFAGIPYVENLDLATMHGLLGHISIAAKLGGAKRDVLEDFELAVNIPKCTFYLSADETKKDGKIDLPSISFSIFVKDIQFTTDGKIADVIPAAASEAVYFSPANIDVGGDIYIKNTDVDLDDTFRFRLVSSVNPFNLGEAKASLKIERCAGAEYNEATAKNFLTITYNQKDKVLCMSGTLADDKGTDLYTYNFEDGSAPILKWLGLDTWQGIEIDPETGVFGLKKNGENAKPAMKALIDNKLAKAILEYFASIGSDDEDELAEAEEDESFSINNIGDYINGFKAIYDDLVKNGVIKFDADKKTGSVVITPEVINRVTAAINALHIIPMQLPTDIEDPKYIKAYLNTEEYKDMLYITVSYGGNVYELTFDDSQEEEFSVIFQMTTETRVYIFKAVGESRGAASFTVTFDVNDKAGVNKSHTQVTFSNFSFNWGAKNDTEVLGYTADEIKDSTSIFADDGIATALVRVVMNFLNKDSIEPVIEEYVKSAMDKFMNSFSDGNKEADYGFEEEIDSDMEEEIDSEEEAA